MLNYGIRSLWGRGVCRALTGQKQRDGEQWVQGAVRIVPGMELGLYEVRRRQKKLGGNRETDKKLQILMRSNR